MNKTIAETSKAIEGLTLKNGNTVSVLNGATKRYVKATVLCEIPTSEYEIAKYALAVKVKDKKSTLVCDISAIHDASIIGQLAN